MMQMKAAGASKTIMMTTDELAKYFRISRASVYRLVKNKEVPVSRVGQQLRFRKDAIDNWILKNEEKNHKQ